MNWLRNLINALLGKNRIGFHYLEDNHLHAEECEMSLVYSRPDVLRQHLERYGYQQVKVRPATFKE